MSRTATTATTIVQADEVTATQKIDTNYAIGEFEGSVDETDKIITSCTFDLNSRPQTLTLLFSKNTMANDRSNTFKVKSTLSSNYGEELCTIYFTQKGTGSTPTDYLWIDDMGNPTASETINSAGGPRQHTILTSYNFSALRPMTPYSWIKDVSLTQEENTIILSYTIDANTETGAVRRSGRVSVYGGGSSHEVYVVIDQQAGTPSSFSFTDSTSNVDSGDTSAQTTYNNLSLEGKTVVFVSDGDGVDTITPKTAESGSRKTVKAYFPANTDTENTKTRKVEARADNSTGDVLDTWTITQAKAAEPANSFKWKHENDEASDDVSFTIDSNVTTFNCSAITNWPSVNIAGFGQHCQVSPNLVESYGTMVTTGITATFDDNTGEVLVPIYISAYTGQTLTQDSVVGKWVIRQRPAPPILYDFKWVDNGTEKENMTINTLYEATSITQDYRVTGYSWNEIDFVAGNESDIIAGGSTGITKEAGSLYGSGKINFNTLENEDQSTGRSQTISAKSGNDVLGVLTITQGKNPGPVVPIFYWNDGTSLPDTAITSNVAATVTGITGSAASNYNLVKFTTNGQNYTVNPTAITSDGALNHRITATFGANTSPITGRTITISAYTGDSITEESVLGVWTIEQEAAGPGPIDDGGDLIDDGGLVIDDPDNPTPGDDHEPIIDDPDPTPGDGPELSQNE